jgi:hypothetical protein
MRPEERASPFRGMHSPAQGMSPSPRLPIVVRVNTTLEQVSGTAHPSAWAVFAGGCTDLLFTVGGLAFGLAAIAYQRAWHRRTPSRTRRISRSGRR